MTDALRAIHETCTFCPKLCRFACPVAEAEARETVTPWGLMTRADDVRRGALALDAETAELWGHCTGCGRCTQICKHHNPVFDAILAARAAAQDARVAPAALTRWAAEAPADDERYASLPATGAIRLVPGHATAAEIADALTVLEACKVAIGRPAGVLRVSGARATEAGDEARGRATTAALRNALAGAETVVCLEASDALALADGWQDGPTIVDWVAFVAERFEPTRPVLDGDVLFLDSCRLGRKRGVFDAPRALLGKLISGQIVEATMNREEGGCCGRSAGYAALHPTGAAQVAQEAAADAPALPVVSAQPGCARHLAASLAPRPVHALTRLLARAARGPERSEA